MQVLHVFDRIRFGHLSKYFFVLTRVGEIISGMRTVYFRFIFQKLRKMEKHAYLNMTYNKNVRERCKKLTY
jgi:hypothetical protein